MLSHATGLAFRETTIVISLSDPYVIVAQLQSIFRRPVGAPSSS